MSFKNGIYRSDAPEEKTLVFSGKGKIMSAYALNLAAAKRYVWLFDAIAPAGAVDANLIAGPFPMAADPGAINLDIDPDEVFGFQNGLYVASSTTGGTYTASTTPDLRLTITIQKYLGP